MFSKICSILMIMLLATIEVNAETQPQGTIKMRPKTNQGIVVGKPHTPAFIPIECSRNGEQITVVSVRPVVVTAEVYVSSTTETVASYFSGEAAETHTFYVEPQNDYLTIDIEVDGRMFTGEFYR